MNRIFQRIAALAVMGAVVVVGTAPIARAQAPAAAEKKVKDQGEYDIYNQTMIDKANFPALLKDVETWSQKYPDSDYKDDRTYWAIQAYNGTKQPAKVLETGAPLLERGLKSVYNDPKAGPSQVLSVLYLMSFNILQLPNPTPEQLAIGDKAARQLQTYIEEYFTAANKGASSDADWASTKNQVANVGKAVLALPMALAMRPGADAMTKYRADKNPANCKVAEDAYMKALTQYPDGAAIAYNLGTAEICLYKTDPSKIHVGLYELARAVGIDATLGGTVDAKAIENYLGNAYKTYHGSDEGLQALKDMAKASPMPPADFKIKSSSELDLEKAEEFKKSNPQLAMWLGIRSSLADAGGEAYFESSLKSAAVPKLKGTVVEGKPACRSKEILVALSDTTKTEIALKLDAALTGKPEAGTEIQWEGVPSAFTKEPFLLTMDTEKAKIEGLKVTPCAAAPAKKGVSKKK
jgi:hypothetical protein